jgi:phosphoserine phosphatase
MLAASGLGIAFNAKPKVQQQAKARINQPSLIFILFLLGLSAEDFGLLSGK